MFNSRTAYLKNQQSAIKLLKEGQGYIFHSQPNRNPLIPEYFQEIVACGALMLEERMEGSQKKSIFRLKDGADIEGMLSYQRQLIKEEFKSSFKLLNEYEVKGYAQEKKLNEADPEGDDNEPSAPEEEPAPIEQDNQPVPLDFEDKDEVVKTIRKMALIKVPFQ